MDSTTASHERELRIIADIALCIEHGGLGRFDTTDKHECRSDGLVLAIIVHLQKKVARGINYPCM